LQTFLLQYRILSATMMEDETKIEDATKAEETKKEDREQENEGGTIPAVMLTDEDLKDVEGVKERLRFFFSDANVRQDLYIRKLLTQSGEKSVPVEALLRFNTVKKYTDKPAVVIQAAKELTDSLVVNEEKIAISRVIPFTDEMMKQNIPKSLYVQNLPMKETGDGDKKIKKYDVYVDEIRAIFSKYGDVALVKLKFSTFHDNEDSNDGNRNKRSRNHKFPIGAGMVEFHKQEDLEKAAEATLTFKNGEKIDPKEKTTLVESDTRKSVVELDVMLLSEYVKSRKEMKGKKSSDSNNNNNKRHKQDEEKEIRKFTVDWKSGCVIKIRGLPEGCDRETLLDCVAKGLAISVEDVKSLKVYVDFSRGQTEGAIRFPEQSDIIMKISKKLIDGELTILDTKVEQALILEGEEEKKYWESFIEFKNKQILLQHDERHSRGKRQRR